MQSLARRRHWGYGVAPLALFCLVLPEARAQAPAPPSDSRGDTADPGDAKESSNEEEPPPVEPDPDTAPAQAPLPPLAGRGTGKPSAETDLESTVEDGTSHDDGATSDGSSEVDREPNEEADADTGRDHGSSDEARGTSEPSDSSEEPHTTSAEPELVPRLPSQPDRSHLPRSAPLSVPSGEVISLGPPDRREEMPGNVAARPLSLPRGTLFLEFSFYNVVIDHEPVSARVPSFAWGITERVELGVTAPLRFDDGLVDWTALDPTPHLLVTALDRERFELGVRLATVIPASSAAYTQLALSVPVRVHTSSQWRIDAEPRMEWSAQKDVGLLLGLWMGAFVQATPALYLGLSAGPELALGPQRQSGVDARFTLGTMLQSRERARVDLEGQFFFENLGGGAPGHFSDGGGFNVALRFYPEMY